MSSLDCAISLNICDVLFQNKLQGLAGQQADMLETLSPPVRKRVEALREIQVLLISVLGLVRCVSPEMAMCSICIRCVGIYLFVMSAFLALFLLSFF